MNKEKKLIKYVGIDWGEKRIGLAVADNENWMAMPRAVIGNFDELLEFLADEEPNQIVIGMPYTMAGEKGIMADRVAKFIEMLKVSVNYPIAEIDERLTSGAVDSLYSKKNRPEERDAISAMLILQSYIDRLDKGEKQNTKPFPKLDNNQ